MADSSTRSLRNDARAIWQAGVDAVDSERLVREAVQRGETALTIWGQEISLDHIGRIVVVGAGKAGTGMAAALESAVGEDLLRRLTGWVNVPADCVRPLKKIHLHAARPAGVNEPTEQGVLGAEKILELIGNLSEKDVCLVLLSGGGSALLPAPAEGITLSDKQAVTRKLMHSGATIQELNTVRKQLSRIKGGRLAGSTNAGQVIALILSDVIGDPLDVIASGPTVPDTAMPEEALKILEKYAPQKDTLPASVWNCLEQKAGQSAAKNFPAGRVRNHIIGSNAVAVAAAAKRAETLGYEVLSLGSENAEEARIVGQSLARLAKKLSEEQNRPSPLCILSGGEPVVHLVPTDQPRKGGRNQEVALSALIELWPDEEWNHIVLLSGGTDGEDGPTDAAGAFADAAVKETAVRKNLDPLSFLAINNSYPFFEKTNALFKTGPTHTNVMDLRVVLVGGTEEEGNPTS